MPVIAQIVAAGASIPRLRLPRAVIGAAMGWLGAAPAKASGARSVCNWDEDALTLAVEAGRSALCRPDGTRVDVDALYLASTTLPFADRSNAALAAACLDLPDTTETLEFGGALRAGTGALANAARRTGRALVVGCEARLAKPGSALEGQLGHGAAGLVVAGGSRAPAPLADILGCAQRSANFVDHYRMAGEDFDYSLEERWVRDEALSSLPGQAIEVALRDAGVAPADVRHFVMPGSSANVKRIATSAGLKNAALADTLSADCGDTGAAHALLMLVATLERAADGEPIVLASFGQGIDVIVLRAAAGLEAWRAAHAPVARALARRREEPHYTRYLSHAGLLGVDFGMRAERDNRTAHSVAWRKHEVLDAFRGGRCSACDTVQYPRSRVCVNPQCRATDTQQSYGLADSGGVVKTFTEDWQAYSQRPPYVYGNVTFTEGGNLFMEFTDLDAGELAVGDAVRFVLRVKDVDALRRFRRYFWKAVKA